MIRRPPVPAVMFDASDVPVASVVEQLRIIADGLEAQMHSPDLRVTMEVTVFGFRPDP